jgi:nucleotide-binding universal stress UspA family protein
VRILVGYVDSPEGRAALDRAIEEAKLRGAELIVVHSMRGGTREEAADALHYRDELEGVERRLRQEGVAAEIRELVLGRSPSEDIVALASEADVDLIVIGLRRRSPVGKLVLGSNAQDILLRAEAPVLAVKSPAD